MKVIAAIVTCLVCLSAFSQNSSKFQLSSLNGYFSYDQYIGSNQSFYPIRFEETNYTGNSFEYAHHNFSTGVLARFSLGTKLGLETGAVYSKKDFESLYYCHICDLWLLETIIVPNRYLEIPLLVNYKLIDKKWKLAVSTGIRNSFKINKTPELLQHLDMRNYSVSLQAGMEVTSLISRQFGISLGSYYTQSLINPIKDKALKYKAVNIQLGVNYFFPAK